MSDVSGEIEALFPRPGHELMLGLALGLVVGAVGALFFTPRSGAATRELLRERGLELKDRASHLLRRDNGSPL